MQSPTTYQWPSPQLYSRHKTDLAHERVRLSRPLPQCHVDFSLFTNAPTAIHRMSQCDSSGSPTQEVREVILIAAIGPNRLLGDGTRLPWSLPRDMRLFRRLTIGQAVVMGRKTFESLQSKPLPKRKNVVVTRNPGFVAPGCAVAHSIADAIEMTLPEPRLFIIGGGDVYRQALPFATAVLLTDIFDESPNESLFDTFTGNVYFPALDPLDWREERASRRSYIASSSIRAHRDLKRKGLQFRVRRYLRADSASPRFPQLTGREIEGHLATPRVPQERLLEAGQPDLFPKLLVEDVDNLKPRE